MVRNALDQCGGNIQKTAAERGVGERTLHRWGDTLPHIKKLVEEHGRGRIGRGPSTKATAVSKQQGKNKGRSR